jgi:7-cyano-7-deazaguanine synthase
MTTKEKTGLVSLSGGMDSATVLGFAVAECRDVMAVSFEYGSKHNTYELDCASKLANHYGVDWSVICIKDIIGNFNSNLLLTGGDIPEGHYEASSMSQTVVPGRNTIFFSILLGIAQSKGINSVYCGIHSGDHAIYPDCRPAYYRAMCEVYHQASEGNVKLRAPFLFSDKPGILKAGMGFGVPYQLTRTCYKNQKISCGKCGSCQERLAAFLAIGVEDPIEYESRVIVAKEGV